MHGRSHQAPSVAFRQRLMTKSGPWLRISLGRLAWHPGRSCRPTDNGHGAGDSRPSPRSRCRASVPRRCEAAPDPQPRADLVFPRAKVAVFVDGCYWHGCPEHGTMAKTNADYWDAKIARNRERDAETDKLLIGAGWTVVRAWGHAAPREVVDQIIAVVRCRWAALTYAFASRDGCAGGQHASQTPPLSSCQVKERSHRLHTVSR